MSSSAHILKQESNVRPGGAHARSMIVWLFIVASVMIFAGLTSAYIVKKADGQWYNFAIPSMFQWSTTLIVVSSVIAHFGYMKAKAGDFGMMKIMLVLTFVSGLVFMLLQWMAWVEIYNYEIPVVFGGKHSFPSGSFLYILSALHGMHIVMGLSGLIIVFFKIGIKKVSQVKVVRWYRMGATFWHFLGALWIYLYVFLLINHS